VVIFSDQPVTTWKQVIYWGKDRTAPTGPTRAVKPSVLAEVEIE
jgi:hypothetical protein